MMKTKKQIEKNEKLVKEFFAHIDQSANGTARTSDERNSYLRGYMMSFLAHEMTPKMQKRIVTRIKSA